MYWQGCLQGGRTGRRTPRPAGPPSTGRVGAAAAFQPGKQLWGTADAASDAASDTCLAAPAAALWTQHHPSPARPWQGTSSTNHQSLFWDCFFLETGSWGVGHTSPRSRPRRGQSRVGVWTHGNSPSCPALAALWRPMEPQVYAEQRRGEGNRMTRPGCLGSAAHSAPAAALGHLGLSVAPPRVWPRACRAGAPVLSSRPQPRSRRSPEQNLPPTKARRPLPPDEVPQPSRA